MLIFIGTLHCGHTPEAELIKIIEGFDPSRLLVEISQSDIKNKDIEKYPDEMRAALTWGTNQHIEVRGFDSSIKTLKESTSEEDLKNLDEEQTKIISKHDWKDFNKAQFDKILETKSWQKIVDKTKDNERELEMHKNIIRLTRDSDSDVTVVITGSGHIPFFKSKFSIAEFPLRTA
jgi:hypothetical protein